MKDFKELQSELTTKAKAAGACADQYQRALKAKDAAELLKVVNDNMQWCINNKCVTNEWLASFDTEIALSAGVLNTGIENTGFVNSGYRNSGDSNSGDSNSGYRNSGDRNSGYRNSGDRNSGDWNSGYRNSGDWNSGDRNSGDSNSGNWNSGDRNSGDSNSGYRNSGAFCTDNDPELILFNKPSAIKVKVWEQMEACQLMYNIDPTIWVPMSIMTDEEKAAHPKFETTEGYLKTITMHEAWANMWHNLADLKKALFTSLPNFDSKIFKEITGIDVK